MPEVPIDKGPTRSRRSGLLIRALPLLLGGTVALIARGSTATTVMRDLGPVHASDIGPAAFTEVRDSGGNPAGFEWRRPEGQTYFGNGRLDHFLWLPNGSPQENESDQVAARRAAHLTMLFAEPWANRLPHGESQRRATVSYLLGNDPSTWQSGLKTYDRIRYQDAFHGIDAIFDRSSERLKGTFVVRPMAAPSVIRWRYQGARNVSVDLHGDLIVEVDDGEHLIPILREERPIAWQVGREAQIRPVGIRYSITSDGWIGFSIGPYDHSIPLVIDPSIVFMAQLGHVMIDIATAIDVSQTGEVVIAGDTSSLRFPSEEMPAAGTLTDRKHTDVFVSLLDSDGRLERTIILGSKKVGNSHAVDVLMDSNRHVYVVGDTTASDFPNTNDKGMGRKVVQGTLSDTASAAEDMFITKLAIDAPDCLQTGVNCHLMDRQTSPPPPPYDTYSTYFGGRDADLATAATLDSAGNLVIVGRTRSAGVFSPQRSDVPQDPKEPLIAPGQETTRGGVDMVIAVISPDGRQILNGTLYGGAGDDVARDVAAAPDGTIWIVGTSTSTDIDGSAASDPVGRVLSPLAKNRIGLPGTGNDGVIIGFDPRLGGGSARRLAWFGGGLEDMPTGLAVGADGSIVISGHTISEDWLMRPDGARRLGTSDAFALALDTDSDTLSLRWSDMWGDSTDRDEALSIALDNSGFCYLTGESYSGVGVLDITTFPGQDGESSKGGAGFLRILAPSDGHMIMSARLGSSGLGSSRGLAIALGPGRDVWLAGMVRGTMPGTPAPTPLGAQRGREDAFVVRIANLPAPTATETPSVTMTPSSTPQPPASSTPLHTATWTATTSATATATPHPLYLPIVVRDRDCPPQDLFTDVMLVIDGSTTMELPVTHGGRRSLDVAIDAARLFIDGFLDDTPHYAGNKLLPPRDDRVGLILFNRQAYVIQTLTSNRARIIEALAYANVTDFQSRINLGIETATRELMGTLSAPDRLKAIVLLTDGVVNPDSPADVRTAATAAKQDGIRMFTVGFGQSLDRSLLWEISSEERSSAPYFFESPNEEVLRSVYQRLQRRVPCPEFLYWPFR